MGPDRRHGGIALLVGITVLLVGGLYLIGGDLGSATQFLLDNEPAKVAVRPLEVSTGWLSLVLVAMVLLIAWNPPGTLYSIFVLKFELIAQLAPAFILGI